MEVEEAAVPGATARPQAPNDGPGPLRSSRSSKPQRWALVQVWNGAVLATFENEANAQAALNGLDDDEVVVLAVRS
jgi:hypothetical protein